MLILECVSNYNFFTNVCETLSAKHRNHTCLLLFENKPLGKFLNFSADKSYFNVKS